MIISEVTITADWKYHFRLGDCDFIGSWSEGLAFCEHPEPVSYLDHELAYDLQLYMRTFYQEEPDNAGI